MSRPRRASALSLGALALAILCAACRNDPPEIPVLSTLPEFTLIDQSSGPYGSADLRGKIWVADFIFTRCPDMCPMLSAAMASLQRDLTQEQLWDRVRLVSFSVEPDHDSPEVLRDYADELGAGPNWAFLTGTREEIWQLSQQGFKLPAAESPPDAGNPILHSNKFVLSDDEGRIRGYYDATDARDRLRLLRDLRILADSAA